MLRLAILFILLLIAIFCTIGLIIHFSFTRKIKCSGCSKKIDASLLKCNHCGTFIDLYSGKKYKGMGYMERNVDSSIQETLKKTDKSRVER